MDIIAAINFLILGFSAVSLAYAIYQLRKAQKHINKAIKTCEDVIVSTNSGRWM